MSCTPNVRFVSNIWGADKIRNASNLHSKAILLNDKRELELYLITLITNV